MTPASGPPTTYGWDQANRLTDVSPVATSQGGYVATAPARLLDTRAATYVGTCTPVATCPKATVGTTLELQVTGKANIPTTGVSAVVVNVTAVAPTAGGYLTAWKADTTQPPTPNVTFVGGQTIGNLAIVPVSATGTIKLATAAANADVTVDLSGWYLSTGTASSFNPLPGARVLDTRTGAGHTGTCTPSSCARISAGSTLELQVAGTGGVPATGASAVAVNLTTVSPATVGYLTAYSSDLGAAPGTASLVWTTGAVVQSGLSVVKIGSDGGIRITASAATDVTVDVEGWYAPLASSGYSAGTPVRMLDTRAASRTGTCTGTCSTLISDKAGPPATAAVPLIVHAAGLGGVPANATAVVATITAIPASGIGSLVAFASGAAPATTNVAWTAGTPYVSDLAVIKLDANGYFTLVANTTNSDVTIDVEGWYTPVPATSAHYAYNGDGLRTAKVVNGTTSAMVWDPAAGGPANLLSDGTNSYLYGPDGVVFEHIDGSGVPTWYHHDQLGSTRLLSNNAGAVVGTMSYDSYGRPTATSGTSSPLGYAGQYTDPETGLIYMRARYYDPQTGQFLNRDPAVAITGQPYAYARNNSINSTDPSGLWPWDGKCIRGINCPLSTPSIATTWAQDHPQAAQQVDNFAGGALTLNPIFQLARGAGALTGHPISLASHGVQSCSGWYHAGQAAMGLVDVLGPFLGGVGAAPVESVEETFSDGSAVSSTDVSGDPSGPAGLSPEGPAGTGPSGDAGTGPGGTGPGQTGPGRSRPFGFGPTDFYGP
jgi:RHS repeat-associated protein